MDRLQSELVGCCELATLWIGCTVFYKYIPKSPLHLFCQNISFISTDCNHEHSFIEKVKTCPKEALCGDNYHNSATV